MDVNLILDELHAERRWLQTVIDILKPQFGSNPAALSAAIQEISAGWRSPGWALRLSPRERARLVRLAKSRRRRPARSPVVPIRQEQLAGAA